MPRSLTPMLISLCGYLALLCGCSDPAEDFDRAALKAFPSGGSMRVSALTSFEFKSVCLLAPYQQRINEHGPDYERANAYLSSIKYMGDEGLWALMLIGPDEIRLISFHRSERLDVMGKSEADKAGIAKTLNNVALADCTLGDRAVLKKVRLRDRPYVMLGEEIA